MKNRVVKRVLWRYDGHSVVTQERVKDWNFQKKEMETMKKTILLTMMVVMAGLLSACNLYETDKANKLVDEANVSITDGNDKINKGNDKLVEMETAVPNIEDEAGLEKARGVAKDSIALLEKARDQYKVASGKFEEASKLKLQDKFKEYLDTKSKEMKKRSDIADALLGEPQALVKSDSKEEYQKAVETVVAKVKGLRTEADDLATKADKITAENKEIFKTN
jgi:hypothetical protein